MRLLLQNYRHKLDNRGVSHLILPLLVVLAIGIGGSFYLVSSNAATKRNTGTIKVKAYAQRESFFVDQMDTRKCAVMPDKKDKHGYKAWRKQCRVKKDRNASLIVVSAEPIQGRSTMDGNKCTYTDPDTKKKKTAYVSANMNLGPVRTLKCTPGSYKLGLDNGRNIKTNKIFALKYHTFHVTTRSSQTFNLGAFDRTSAN